MDDAAQTSSSPASSLKQRTIYACEACRASKSKCEPGDIEGICRRCLASKKECIFKTGPRKRRRRSKLHPVATRSTPPFCAPSKTFTIDVPMQADGDNDEDPLGSLENLKDFHEEAIELLVSNNDVQDDGDMGMRALPAPSPAGSGSATSVFTSSTRSRSTHSFSSIQPQFNLDSATSLLRSFADGMLPHFPIIFLPSNVSVSSMAKEQPFVLLAILAAASSVRSLQGHSLYDAEFRKVLGLKVVSGGERSLELLIGLLIYCAWYPFHLRPKNKQSHQYLRMAGDIVRDLEFDEPPEHLDITQLRADENRMSCIRAYLACYYLCSVFASTFQKKHNVPYVQWTETCCNILDRDCNNEEAEADRALVWLVRLGHIMEENTSLGSRQKGIQHSPQHLQLMYKGLEAQFREWKSQIPADAATKPVLRMANWCTEMLLYGQPLLRIPSKTNKTRPTVEFHIDAERLLRCVNVLRLWLEYVLSLPPSEFLHFIATEWSYFVISIILGLKLSFPLPEDCPSWDHAAARKILNLGSFLEKFSSFSGNETQPTLTSAPFTMTDSDKKRSTGTDVLSASKTVICIVQKRYDRRLATLEEEAAASYHAAHEMQTMVVDDGINRMRNCPMFDGSMNPYLEVWDETFLNTLDYANPALIVPTVDSGYVDAVNDKDIPNPVIKQTGFHDLWATMTMGWGQDAS